MSRIDHTAFEVSDLDAAVRFYTALLGFRLLSRSIDQDQQEAFAFLELEGGRLELIQKLGRPFAKPHVFPPFCPHIALAVEDISRTAHWAADQGITVLQGPSVIPGEATWMYVADADNNLIEYIQWLRSERG